MEKYNLNVSTMGVNLPFKSYLLQQKQIKTLELQNEAFKKATKGMVIVLAKVPENVKYESYTQLGKLDFIDVRYEGVYEFISNVNENLKKVLDERVIKMAKDKEALVNANKKLEYKISKLANESSVIAANVSLLDKVQHLGSENKELKKQLKELSENKEELEYKELYEKLKTEFNEQQNTLKRVILQEEIANRKIEELSNLGVSLNKVITDLRFRLGKITRNPIYKLINYYYEQRERRK